MRPDEEKRKPTGGGHPPPKPFTTPVGWKPPSLAEQLAYFYKTHGHRKNYAYGAVVLFGLAFWTASASSKNSKEESAAVTR